VIRWLLAGTAVLVLAAGFIGVRAHPPVSMTNDHEGQSAFATPLPGQTRMVGGVRLGNAGMLPYTYEMHVQEPLPDGGSLRIERVEDGATLYAGPLRTQPVALGSLSPGRQVTLKLVLTQPAAAASAPTLIWSARAVAPALDAAAAGWAVVAALAGFDVLLVAAWLREMRRSSQVGVRFP